MPDSNTHDSRLRWGDSSEHCWDPNMFADLRALTSKQVPELILAGAIARVFLTRHYGG